MENPKALQTFVDLEQARCNERWSDIPELAKRYKKYHPYQSVLEFTARMEAEFILLVRQWRHESIGNTVSTTDSEVDLSATPSTTNNAQGRKWGNRQLINQPSISSSNLNSSPIATTVKRNYPEESDFYYQLDDPNSVSLLPRLPPSHVQLVLVRLLDVIQRQIKSGELETPDDWQAQFSKIVLARIYFESGRYDKALEWLQHLALRLEDVERGYGLVLLVQARVIKGVCFEMQENYTEALDSYLGALKVVEQHPEEKSKALFYWLEDCLYRSVLLQLRRKGPVKQTLKLMRTYLHYCCTEWPNDWRIHKRWVVFRHYIRYLTRAYQKGVYVPASPDDEYTNPISPTLTATRSVFSEAGETTLFERSAAALDETMQLMTQFRNLLAAFAPLLNKKNPIDLNHRVLELSNLLVAAHDTVGWGPVEYIRRTRKFLNRSRKFTFNSVCISRHLFYTLLRLGEMQEAKLALTHYLELLGVPHLIDRETLTNENQEKSHIDGDSSDEEVSYLEELVETIQDRLEYIAHESQATANKNLLSLEKTLCELADLPESEDDDNVQPTLPKKKTPIGSCESDTEFDVVRLVLAAAQQLYGQHDGKGQEATVLSDVAVTLLEESEHLKRKKASQWKSLMAQSRRVRGSSYSLYSSQCRDEKKRSEYQVEALVSYKRAAELDSRSWQTYYELGLQQAIIGDMVSATSSVKRSIKLRGDFIPSWHLLALVQSAHQFNALPKSLQLIQAGLGYHMNMIENFDNEEESDLVLTLDTEEGLEFFDRAEAYMRMRMSQTYFLEILEGAEAVLKIYPDLFDMYAKLSKKMKIDVATAAAVIEKESSLGHHKSSTVSQHRQDSLKSLSHPRSRSNTINNSSIFSSSSIFDDNDSLNSSSFALPPAVAKEDDDALPNVESARQLTEESESTQSSTLLRVDEKEEPEEEQAPLDRKKSKHKQRRSISTMNDPLLSLSSLNKKKKEKKEPKPKKTGFLSFRSSSINIPSSDTPGQTRESSTNLLKATMSQEELISSSLVLQESTNSIKPPFPSQQQHSSYFSSLSQLNQQDQQSTSSIPLSNNTTTVHKNAYYTIRQERWQTILVLIWIMASATYTRAQRYDEAFKAISEADQLTNGNSADVWHQIGLIILKQRGADYQDRALEAFKKALSIDPEHVTTHTSLASVYLDMEQVELAEQLLERSAKGLGWNQTEAWYLLSKVYRAQDNILDAKHSLTYALMLSDTSPMLPLDSLPRFV